MFGQFILFIVLSLLFACSGSVSEAGRLMPQAGDGVSLTKTQSKNDTAQITAAGALLKVGGAWAKQSFQRLEIEIANQSAVPFSFDYLKVSMQTDTGEKLVLNRVADVTGVDVSDTNPNNDTVNQSYSQDVKSASTILIIAAWEHHVLNLQFNNSTQPENKLSEGKTVIVTIPTNDSSDKKIFFSSVADKLLD